MDDRRLAEVFVLKATDTAVIRRHVLIALAGVLVAAGSTFVGQLPIRDVQVLAALSTYVVIPGYLLAGLILVTVTARNRWYFSPHKRLERTLGREGWLTRYDLRLTAGAAAMRTQAGYIRPDLSLRRDGSRQKQRIAEYGTCVGRVVSGSWWVRGRRVYSPHSRGVLVLGPQGSGKSSWLVHQVLDFPGAAYVSSTKPELATMTARARSSCGPVHVFNPAGLGDLPGTFAWDPVAGCEDQAVADRRAWALVRGGGGAAGIDRADFWAQKAQEIIRAYLLAAALVGYDMGVVHYWATNPDDLTPVGILQSHPDWVPAGWVGTLESSLTASHNTRTGYFATVVSCVGFMDNPRVAVACRPGPNDHFDMAEFLRGGTLYAVAGEDPRLSPLVTALTEHVFSQAKLDAAAHPGGRLPDGLAMILDEVAQTTPVPLDKWAADSRGWGITVTAVVQDLAQLRTTWGPDRAQTIYANLPAKVVLPGVANKEDLESLAYLAGRRKVAQVTEGHSIQAGGMVNQRSLNRSHHLVDEQVIRGEAIYGLPQWHAYVLGLAPRAVVVRYEPGYVRARRINGHVRR